MYDYVMEPEDVNWIASLTSLTQLTLKGVVACQDMQPLLTLQLQKFSVVHCDPIQAQLFVPGAWRCLTSLHIEGYGGNAAFTRAESENDSNAFEDGDVDLLEEQFREFAERAHQLASIVLDMPCLREISGHGGILRWSLAERLQSWQQEPYDKWVPEDPRIRWLKA